MAVFLKPFHHSSLKDLYPNLFSISTYQRKKTPQLKKKKTKRLLGKEENDNQQLHTKAIWWTNTKSNSNITNTINSSATKAHSKQQE